jgi:hypothetical protein
MGVGHMLNPPQGTIHLQERKQETSYADTLTLITELRRQIAMKRVAEGRVAKRMKILQTLWIKDIYLARMIFSTRAGG